MKSSFSLLPKVSLESFLKEQVGLSGQWIKRHSQFSKAILPKKVNHPKTYDCDLNLLNANIINPTYQGQSIEILHNDDQFLVVNKPERLHGHPLSYQENDNVLSFLRSRNMGQPLNVNTGSQERGLLYRLDFETSGVLILAKNQSVFNSYFKQRMKKKLYFAAVAPGLKQYGDIEAYFKPIGSKGDRMVAHLTEVDGSKLGLTHIKIIHQSKGFDLVSLELFEGHRHQLRSLMTALGHPILGDHHYGGSECSRLLLHASQYILRSENKDLSFVAPLRGEFEDFLNLHGLLQVFHDQFSVG